MLLHGLLNDGHNGTLSSKRVVTVFSFILCAMGFLGDLFWNLDVKDSIYECMMYIVIAGLGFTASEKFTPINKEKSKGLL